MRTCALLLLLLAFAAWGQSQEKQEAPKAQEPPQAAPQAPARPLILRIDELSPSDRASISVQEAPSQKSRDGLPELGGKPSPAYGSGVVKGSGTSAPGSPYPKDEQPH